MTCHLLQSWNLASVLLKMGTYGFVRFSLPLLPEASKQAVWWMVVLAIIGIIYGALVAMAEERGCDLADLPLADMQTVNGAISEDVFTVLSVENSVASRTSFGGTAPVRVREQVAQWKERLA